jgi:hypothetical protein
VQHAANQKFQIISFFSYLDPHAPPYLSPRLFDTSSLSYLLPHAIWHQCLLFGPKSSYIAPSVINTSLFLISLLLSYTFIVPFLCTTNIVPFLRRMLFSFGLRPSYCALLRHQYPFFFIYASIVRTIFYMQPTYCQCLLFGSDRPPYFGLVVVFCHNASMRSA